MSGRTFDGAHSLKSERLLCGSVAVVVCSYLSPLLCLFNLRLALVNVKLKFEFFAAVNAAL